MKPPGADDRRVISAQGVSKSFSGVRALEDVSFDLRPGEVHVLMGENGAGKSTLMKILTGIYRRDAGAILLDGAAVDFGTPRQAQAAGISIVHQELNLMNHLTAAQNIFIGREPRRGWLLDEDTLNVQAAALFDRIKLNLDPRTIVGTLTVARQQMIEIAKALSHQARVLIMDEPTAALNREEAEDLFRVVHDLRAQGVGIVYISHKMDELARIADRVTVMRDGRHVATVAMAEASIDQLIAMMVGRELGQMTREPVPEPSGEPMLEVQGLARRGVLHDVSFQLRRGEILGFAGLMGAGRTEVARAVFGADPIDAGTIRVRGRETAIRSPQQAVAAGIGYLSEDRKHFGLATGLAVQDNILLASLARFRNRLGFVDDAHGRRVSQDLVQRLAIKTPNLEQLARFLSGGNQQKVVIAKWLLRDCDILFFDEPTRGIDVGAKAEIYKLIKSLAAQGKAIVMISSELPEVLLLSHRVIVMCEGRITGELHGSAATQENIMQLATARAELPAAA
ncbi:sugar ABC transporter ATP-binding protein [Methylibium rhizosphaerae]|uniref:sugar ABC transporter ATP-binding protein n=1 Tax=Methylibium rhizosphaerae TaxID=2570323 RepID=UPI00112EB131|nr:sugar ABC transporter ATP-binding protein [Methylibium rhizosphaerae]